MATKPQPEVIPPGHDSEDELTFAPQSGLSAIEEADRSNMVATAKKYPRSLTKFVKDLTALACLSQDVAQQMVYSVPRAGKQLIGPSIRFAEAALSCWGNGRAGYEVVDVQWEKDVCNVVVEGRFYDCETNVGWQPRIKRRVVAKTINADAIQITGAAGSSIAVRTAILRGVPEAIWRPIWEKSRQTAVGDAKSMAQLIEMSWKFFQALGITELQILNALSIPGKADIGPDEILAMNAWQRQLREKESTVEEIFGSPEDYEIEKIMAALEWNDTKKRMCRESFKGKRAECLAHLRKTAEEIGVKVDVGVQQKPMTAQQVQDVQDGKAEVKKEEQRPTTSPEPTDTTAAKDAGEPLKEPSTQANAGAASTTTAAASTSQGNKRKAADDWADA